MENKLIYDVEEKPEKRSQWLLFSIQHILAMLVACITVPILTGLPIAATLVSAGIGTLFYILVTNRKSPVFLSSSFAYLSPMSSALAVGLLHENTGRNYMALILGMILVGLVYVIVALVIRAVGTSWIDKLLPPIVVGPIIMVIGLSLAGSAVSNLTAEATSGYNLIAILCGLIALLATAMACIFGKGKMISLIPFVIGMVCGYLAALIFTIFGTIFDVAYLKIIDFSPLKAIFVDDFGIHSIINYRLFVPNNAESFIFLRFNEIKDFDFGKIGEIILLFVPVSLVTICEHIGDHKNLGNIINRDLLNDEPGMSKTLIGDGVATAISGTLCGAANTTYGENVAVIGTTKVASISVISFAAILTIIIGFITPFTALLATIPGCITGGVSLILYGFIASSGVKMLISEKVDLTDNKNIFIASVILIAGIGGLKLLFGNALNPVITISPIAVAMILGILLNFILNLKKDKPVEEPIKEEVQEAKEE